MQKGWHYWRHRREGGSRFFFFFLSVAENGGRVYGLQLLRRPRSPAGGLCWLPPLLPAPVLCSRALGKRHWALPSRASWGLQLGRGGGEARWVALANLIISCKLIATVAGQIHWHTNKTWCQPFSWKLSPVPTFSWCALEAGDFLRTSS